MSEYLRGFRISGLEGVDYGRMTAEHLVISPLPLANILTSAFQYLRTFPGEHLNERRELAPEWLGWWINYLSGFPSSNELLVPSDKLKSIEDIGGVLRSRKEASGVLFVAAAEGHEGHRHAARWMKDHVKTVVWLFEQDEYLKRKPRGAPFLPLEVRLSMWAHHPGVDLASITPYTDCLNVDELNAYYKRIFKTTDATYCFATKGDPNLEAKIGRGQSAKFTTIPFFPVPSTTERVEILMPDITI